MSEPTQRVDVEGDAVVRRDLQSRELGRLALGEYRAMSPSARSAWLGGAP